MLNNFISKKITNYIALILFLIPLSLLLFFTEKPNLTVPSSETSGFIYHLFTNSAGSPFFLIPVSLLCFIPLLMRLTLKQCFTLWVRFAILLVLAFSAKVVLKATTEIPRPYTEALTQMHVVSSPAEFYQSSDEEKTMLIDNVKGQVNHWRVESWKDSMNYSFPSGHTIFVASCVLFWGGFLLSHRKFIPLIILMTWATGVGFSRYWLGMHWPADLLASIAFSAFLFLFVPESIPLPKWLSSILDKLS
ncbi:phosphatase PAP2 family protein [Vibrio sp. SS-MA-C1-2]|uniref:phosphatase PAP2 family protein n=1 Tax=Vibrio sp. SS-MA-C1-2 TaxID=2908646 RepID=UPI001F3CA72B|nr:phosphatase PAP2 family protein [Vibrio sp. SS-MA-C1-2]UJF17457.1 phosphatase PAP2 family protein [Vibrio sp. SS-MA-C1-2]